MIASFLDWFANHSVAAGLLAAMLLVATVVLVALIRFFRWFVKKRTPCVDIRDVKIIKPAYSSNSGYVSFQVVNTRGGAARIEAMGLVVAANGPSNKFRELQPGKKPDKFDFHVRLRSDRMRFTPRAENLKKPLLRATEGVVFCVQLESEEYYWYRFGIEIKWRNMRGNKEVQTVRCRDQYIEFAAV